MMLALDVLRWRWLGGGIFNAAMILNSYNLDTLIPPPSLRDTSASGGQSMTFSADSIIQQKKCPAPGSGAGH